MEVGLGHRVCRNSAGENKRDFVSASIPSIVLDNVECTKHKTFINLYFKNLDYILHTQAKIQKVQIRHFSLVQIYLLSKSLQVELLSKENIS